MRISTCCALEGKHGQQKKAGCCWPAPLALWLGAMCGLEFKEASQVRHDLCVQVAWRMVRHAGRYPTVASPTSQCWVCHRDQRRIWLSPPMARCTTSATTRYCPQYSAAFLHHRPQRGCAPFCASILLLLNCTVPWQLFGLGPAFAKSNMPAICTCRWCMMWSTSTLTSLIWTSSWSVAKTLSLPGACDVVFISAIHTSLHIILNT